MKTESPSSSATDHPPEQPPPVDCDGVHVEISDTQAYMKLDHDAIAMLVRSTLVAEGVDQASISIALVDDATIQPINRNHLGHDWPTDVITFPLSEPGETPLCGELVVSVEMAESTAKQAGLPSWDELALYVVHGLLHLCGYDDASDQDRAIMRRREAEILARAGLTNTFPAVGGPIAAEPAAGSGRESVRCTI